MADPKTTTGTFDAIHYEPNRTLGRTGHIDEPSDRLALRVEHLDALMCLVTTDDCFAGLNETILHSVLHLAADLAHEVHELHHQVSIARMKGLAH